jgi:xyloglucan fucosyltransferase
MMKEGKAGSFWRNGIVLMSVGTMMLFACLLAMDVETVLAWARVSRRKTAERTDLKNANPETNLPAMNVAHDPECLARTQHLLYRRDPERFAPSPAFTEAWDRYVTMHRACSQGKNWTHAFLHERNNKADDCNYLIVMEGVGGLGNKLLSLTSAFAYGLVTDRVVLVEGRDQFKDLLCDPVPGSSWFLPEDFPYENVTDAEGLNIAIERNFTNTSMTILRLDHIQVNSKP